MNCFIIQLTEPGIAQYYPRKMLSEFDPLLPPTDATFPKIVSLYINSANKNAFLKQVANHTKEVDVEEGFEFKNGRLVFNKEPRGFEKLAETLLLFHDQLVNDDANREDQINHAYRHYIINTNGPIPLAEGEDNFKVFRWTEQYANLFNIKLEEIKDEDGNVVETLMEIDDPDDKIRCEKWGRVALWSGAWSLRSVGQLINFTRYGRNDVIPSFLFPFKFNTRTYSKANAIRMAEFSQLAYMKEDYARSLLTSPHWGFDKMVWIEDKATDTQAFAAAHSDYIIVSFRGTKEPRDFLTDLMIRKKPFLSDEKSESRFGEVHRGFNMAFESVRDQLKATIEAFESERPGRPIFVTGHSLGAALAQLGALYLASIGKDVASVYTFGAPRVGDKDFQQSYEAVLKDRTFLHINNADIVTTIPLKLLGFRHVALPARRFNEAHDISGVEDMEEPETAGMNQAELEAMNRTQMEMASADIKKSLEHLAIRDLTTNQPMGFSYDTSFERGKIDDHGIAQYLFKFACSIVDDRLAG